MKVKFSGLITEEVEELIKGQPQSVVKELAHGKLLGPLTGALKNGLLYVANGSTLQEQSQMAQKFFEFIRESNKDIDKIRILADFIKSHGAFVLICCETNDDLVLLDDFKP